MKILKKSADFLMTPQALIIIGCIIGVIVAIIGGWDYLEPTIGIATLAFSASNWWQTRKAKNAYYRNSSTNPEDTWVVALEVGRPVSEGVKNKFGKLDILIRSEDIIHKNLLVTDTDYEKIARAVYSACCHGQTRHIDLIVSGPTALCAIIGQMLGIVNFKLTLWQFYNGEYQAVPRPTRDWLEHR